MKLLGFRSNKTWKMILSVAYLIFLGLLFVILMSGERQGNITVTDYLIDKASNGIIFLILLSPFIFLSNTRLRARIPLFNKNKGWASFVGLVIVFVVGVFLINIVNGMHSQEYLDDMENHAYKETTIEATCEKNGAVKRVCQYCGRTEKQEISALGHTMKVVINDESVFVEECEVCKKQEITKKYVEKQESNSSEKTSKTSSNKNDYEEIDLQTMLDELDENALRAEKKYQNKYVKVTGKIANFDSDGEYISIEPINADKWNFDTVKCEIRNDKQIDFLLEKDVGDEITVMGKVVSIGEIIGYIIEIDKVYQKSFILTQKP